MTTPDGARLELSGIVKRFGGVTALDGASFAARAGEIHGLCGENGAGKSTLLKVLAGVHPHSSYHGSVRLDGVELTMRSTTDARRAGVAIVHQELTLVPEMTVAENLLLGREPRRFGFIDDAAVEARARALCDRFVGQGSIDVRTAVGRLGIGVQQIVEIVRALQDEARVLVLDEPTAALTGSEAARLFEWLRRLRSAGTTCIYVSHRMDELFALCDRITVLRDGKTVGTVETAKVTGQDVVRLMVGREMAIGTHPSALSADAAAVLEVRSLSVDGAIEDVSLELHAGEVVGLAGAMGSGRTALLSTLFGCATTKVSGEVLLGGAAVQLSSPRAAIAAGMALVPEDRKARGLVLELSVAENLALPLPLADADEAESIAERRIAELRIRGRAGSAVATLSGGNQQKVVLGKWLHHPPRVLLLDEPTRGVDVGAREEIYGIITALCKKGVAVLMASSDLSEVQRLSHRILVLRRGRVIAELPAGASQDDIVAHSTGLPTSPACTP
ncbi:MAG: Ribose transport system, ATP-binding protein RbsA [Myxococcales bacterium]|nr:Ribose transport system, ATP-binding protein RbsA [Myxococcales bacterium]